MKTKLSLLSLAVCAAFSTAAFAQQGQIDFTGEVFDSGCTPTVTGSTGGNNGIVALNPVAPTDFSGADSVTGQRDFDIALAGCTTARDNVWAYFSGVQVTSDGRLNNTGTAGNVNLELSRQNDGGRITLGPSGGSNANGSAPGPNQGEFFTLQGTNPGRTALLRYGVRYHQIAAGAVTPGTVLSTVTYNLIFH